MSRSRIGIRIAAGASFLLGATLFAGELFQGTSPSNDQLPGLMLAKLASTQRVVVGLVSKDFSEIKRGADELASVCDAVQWTSQPDPFYGNYRRELRRHAKRLGELAQGQNLDGAAFAYMQTMSTCISCHEHCRDILRTADRVIPKNGVVPIPVAEEEVGWNSMPTLRR
jgi:hypothetical protein